MTAYKHRPIDTRRNRPTYCQVVRNGLRMIAARTEATSYEEKRALEWIVEMHYWHNKVVMPYQYAEYKRRKKRPEGARS